MNRFAPGSIRRYGGSVTRESQSFNIAMLRIVRKREES